MSVFWWVSGLLLAAVWLDRARDARGMRAIPDLAQSEFDRQPIVQTQQTGLQPQITVVVPARNEEQHIGATLRSLLAQDYPVEVIAVDDRSTDRTGAIMDEIYEENERIASQNRLRVMHITDLPRGWLGKTHAMWLAAQQATGDWLLFTDADGIFRRDVLRRALVYAEQSGTDHLVVFPNIPAETVGGHMMLAFFEILFVFGHRPWKVSDPKTRDSIGFGSFNLIRRTAYEGVGTWQPLRMAVVEDMKLGELAKQKGFRSRCAFGLDLMTSEWARTGLDMIRNLEKNFFAVMRYRPSFAIAGSIALLFVNLLPFAGVVLANGWARAPFVAALMGLGALYWGLTRRSHISWLYFFLHPLATIAFVYVVLRSMMHALLNGGVIWRGTKYTLEELRREYV